MAKDNTISEAALKRAKEFYALMEKSEKSSKKQAGFWGDISQSFLGIGRNDFFKQIPHSTAQIEMMKDSLIDAEKIIAETSTKIDRGFGNIILSMSKIQKDALDASVDNFAKLDKPMAHAIKKVIESGDMSSFIEKYGKEGTEMFRKLVKDEKGLGKLEKFIDKSPKKLLDARDAAGQLAKKLGDGGTEALALGDAISKMFKNAMQFINPERIKESLLGFDQVLSTSQKNTGIAFKKNSADMTELVNQTSRFGMDIAQASELMSDLSAGLRTTDFKVLSGAAEDMSAISMATGISIGEIGELGSQMMLFGKTSKDVSKFAENTMKSAQNFGVNGKKIMADITKNLPKFRQMGFQGGEESLKRMALQAEMLGQNIDEIFDVAKRSRTIEGALDMAASLQLAGGSFSNINPMDLLAAARKSPEELQKILSKMGSDIGTFNEKTGQMDFGAVDIDRLGIVAESTGMSIDSLQKQITKTAQNNQKTKLLPPGLFEGLSPEEQSFLVNSMKTKDGKLIEVGVKGVTDLANLNQTNIRAAMEAGVEDKKTLAEQAEQNMSFQDSVKALKDGIMNLFTVFEPAIQWLTGVIQSFNEGMSKLSAGWKMIIMGAIGAFALLFGPAKQFVLGISFGKGHKVGLGMSGGGGIGAGGQAGIRGGGWLSGLATELKEASKAGKGIDLGGVAKMAGSIVLLSLPLTMALLFVGKEKALVAYGLALVELGAALWLTSKATKGIDMGGILKGSLAMLLIGSSLIPFSYAMTMLEGVSWSALAKAGVGILGLSLIVLGLGALMTGPGALLLGGGMLALAALGVTMLIVGKSFESAAPGFVAMSGVDWGKIGGMGSVLLSLMGAGILGIMGSIGIIGMTMSLGALAGVITILAPALSIASESINSMAIGVERLKSAIKGLDVSTLESLADVSNKMSNTSAISGLANAINGMTGGVGAGKQTIELKPITVNLKLNGRQLQTIIVEDVQHVT